jgi:hypothetical protein
MIVGGPPGVGKSAVTWEIATGFGGDSSCQAAGASGSVAHPRALAGDGAHRLVGSCRHADTKIEGDKLREGEHL